ncbi:hypothetical protein D3C87_1889890 [compost metagenome]
MSRWASKHDARLRYIMRREHQFDSVAPCQRAKFAGFANRSGDRCLVVWIPVPSSSDSLVGSGLSSSQLTAV